MSAQWFSPIVKEKPERERRPVRVRLQPRTFVSAYSIRREALRKAGLAKRGGL